MLVRATDVRSPELEGENQPSLQFVGAGGESWRSAYLPVGLDNPP
jgi:hypothetical protein